MEDKMTWSFLAHIGFNMYADHAEKDGIKCNPWRINKPETIATDYLRFDKEVFHRMTEGLAAAGCNQIILDLAEGVRYDSHPELAIEGTLSKKELSDEITRLRGLGFEVIPKLNFSTGHDLWLGKYARMVSTPEYYQVCSDLIDEVCELFGKPRLFHLGMDEECFSIQETMNLCIIRHGDLFWHDFYYLVKCCEKNGARPWIWADYMWHTNKKYEQSFIERMSRDVLISNWYYNKFEHTEGWLFDAISAYEKLNTLGFDQVPAGGNDNNDENLDLTVAHCTKVIAPERLKGFLMTTWSPTLPKYEEKFMRAINDVKLVTEKYNNGGYNK